MWATSHSATRSQALGSPQAVGVMLPPYPLVGHLLSYPLLRSGGDPPGGRGYVATLVSCGPPVILFPALKRWGPPRRRGSCNYLAHLWASSDSAPCSQAVGTHQAAKDGLRERSTQRRHASAPADRGSAIKTSLLPRSIGHQRGRKPPTPNKMWTPPKNTRSTRGRQRRRTEHEWYEGIPNGQPMRKEVMV